MTPADRYVDLLEYSMDPKNVSGCSSCFYRWNAYEGMAPCVAADCETELGGSQRI